MNDHLWSQKYRRKQKISKNKVRTCIQSLPPSKIPFLCYFFPFLFPVLIRMHHKILKQQIFIHNSKCLCLCCTCMFVSIHHDKSPLTFTFHKSTFFNNFYFHFLVTVGYGVLWTAYYDDYVDENEGSGKQWTQGRWKRHSALIKISIFYSRILKIVYSLIWGLKTPHNTTEQFEWKTFFSSIK